MPGVVLPRVTKVCEVSAFVESVKYIYRTALIEVDTSKEYKGLTLLRRVAFFKSHVIAGF